MLGEHFPAAPPTQREFDRNKQMLVLLSLRLTSCLFFQSYELPLVALTGGLFVMTTPNRTPELR